jgi:hypothetical protein
MAKGPVTLRGCEEILRYHRWLVTLLLRCLSNANSSSYHRGAGVSLTMRPSGMVKRQVFARHHCNCCGPVANLMPLVIGGIG